MSSSVDLHLLDLGFPRFLEYHFTVVLPGEFEVGQYRQACYDLVSAWPILGSRLNAERTQLLYDAKPDYDNLFRDRAEPVTIAVALPSLEDAIRTTRGVKIVRTIELDSLFRHDNHSHKQPLAFQMSAIKLVDGLCLRTTIQHPLCDAMGMYRIMTAYTSVLAGQPIDPIRNKANLALRSETEGMNQERVRQHEEQFRSAAREHHGKLKSISGMKSSRMGFGSSKSTKMSRSLKIPREAIEQWREKAKEMNVQVSRNDLVMAWIYFAGKPEIKNFHWRMPNLNHQLSMVVNIEGLLNNQAELDNPTVLVTVKNPSPPLSITSDSAIPKMASRIREALNETRTHESLRSIIKDHQDVSSNPLAPGKSGRQNDVVINSWGHLNLYELKFPCKGSGDGYTEPRHVSADYDVCSGFRGSGLSSDEVLVTWQDLDGGCWISGKLDQNAWKKLIPPEDEYHLGTSVNFKNALGRAGSRSSFSAEHAERDRDASSDIQRPSASGLLRQQSNEIFGQAQRNGNGNGNATAPATSSPIAQPTEHFPPSSADESRPMAISNARSETVRPMKAATVVNTGRRNDSNAGLPQSPSQTPSYTAMPLPLRTKSNENDIDNDRFRTNAALAKSPVRDSTQTTSTWDGPMPGSFEPENVVTPLASNVVPFKHDDHDGYIDPHAIGVAQDMADGEKPMQSQMQNQKDSFETSPQTSWTQEYYRSNGEDTATSSNANANVNGGVAAASTANGTSADTVRSPNPYARKFERFNSGGSGASTPVKSEANKGAQSRAAMMFA